MSHTADIEVPEEVVEAPVSITKPKKVKKERTPAQKEAFAKAQAKRQETMKAKKLAKAQALLDAEKKAAEPAEPAPEPVVEEKPAEPEKPAPAPKKKRAPRKKKAVPEEQPPTMTITPVSEKTAPVPEATDIPPIPAEPASVPTPPPAPEKKTPAPKKQETLVSVKKREKSKPAPKEIVYEDSDSESDDPELLQETYIAYKKALKRKKAQRKNQPAPAVMRELKFV